MKSASRAGAFDALQRGDHLLRHLRQQLQDLDRALLQRTRARPSISASIALRIVDVLHARDRERLAVEELQHAKAPQALARSRGARRRASVM